MNLSILLDFSFCQGNLSVFQHNAYLYMILYRNLCFLCVCPEFAMSIELVLFQQIIKS